MSCLFPASWKPVAVFEATFISLYRWMGIEGLLWAVFRPEHTPLGRGQTSAAWGQSVVIVFTGFI